VHLCPLDSRHRDNFVSDIKPISDNDEQVGVIFVHGIGEQRRFEHLDGQTRFLIDALRDFTGVDRTSVTINPHSAAGFRAQSDTWCGGPDPSVTICVHHTLAGKAHWTKLQIHEVWWADVNESYSIAKQFRFWLWALTIWVHGGKQGSTLPTANRVVPPVVPNHLTLFDRLRLFLLSTFFALLAMSVGAITFVVTRVFNWQAPDILQVLANYVSAVKLYNQRRRFGSGLWWAREDFLDTVGEPPRVSVRRRMIRAIADVACKPYLRWYVLAHSQGSIVAFNGLMETAYAWPGYLDADRWSRLRTNNLVGPAANNFSPPAGTTMPPRPAWVADNEIAYRSRLFDHCAGFLTYGCPLEKFAGLWPALVPISREPAFKANTRWINLFDPIDPISGRLAAFQEQPTSCCPRPQNIGYCASWWLLLAHIKYLTHRKPSPDAATATLRWLLTDNPSDFSTTQTGWRPGKWMGSSGTKQFGRTIVAWTSWFVAAGLLACAAAFVVPMVYDAALTLWHALFRKLTSLG
jgi:hypothetical protein